MSLPDYSASDTIYDDMIVHDSREAAPEGFVHAGNLPLDKTIDLQIGLHSRGMSGLIEQLYAVSTPGSLSYGKHLGKEEVESYARPTDETVRKVNAWLAHYGVQHESIGPSGDRLQITVPVSKANEMLQTTFSTFRHTETGTESYQALSYSIPSQLTNMIQSIEPTTSFPNPSSRPTVQTLDWMPL